MNFCQQVLKISETYSRNDICFEKSLGLFILSFFHQKDRKPLMVILYKLVYFYPIIDVNFRVKLITIHFLKKFNIKRNVVNFFEKMIKNL